MYAVTRTMLNLQRVSSSPACIVQVRSSSGTKSLPQSHYDTLEIKSNATQSEIKTAYYKLTMQYHPDRNKLVSAKQKFQDISDAYEVLSNRESRKRYDNTIKIREERSSYYDVNAPRSRPLRRNPHPHDINIYNFDEWTRQHYGKIFMEQQARKAKRRAYQASEEAEEQMDTSDMTNMIYNLILFGILIMFITVRTISVEQNRKMRSRPDRD